MEIRICIEIPFTNYFIRRESSRIISRRCIAPVLLANPFVTMRDRDIYIHIQRKRERDK